MKYTMNEIRILLQELNNKLLQTKKEQATLKIGQLRLSNQRNRKEKRMKENERI